MLLSPEREAVVRSVTPNSAGAAIRLMRIACILFAAAAAWTSRYSLTVDGVAYLDLAHAWLRGDWPMALNSYWSPLYPWMLAAAIRLLPPGPAGELLAAHIVNLAGFLLSLAAWEFLMREWTAWQGGPRHPRLMAFAGYATVCWAGLHLVGIAFNSADIFVMAEILYLAAALVRIRRGAAALRDFLLMGVVLGIGFLAKAAGLALIPAALLPAAILLRGTRSVASIGKTLGMTAAVCTMVCAPFVAALSMARHHFVYSDTGWVNYALVVDGQSIEGYKDSVHAPPAAPLHPQVVRHEDPRVLSFENHLTGTFPVHTDPSWWAAGYRASLDWSRQLRVVRQGLLFTFALLAGNPALWLLLIALVARRREFRMPELWYVALPAALATAPYWMILVHARYIAGPLALAGFLCLAALGRVELPAAVRKLAWGAVAIAVCSTMWYDLVSVPFYLAGEAIAGVYSPEKHNLDLAEAMQRAGLRPGDRVGYIGYFIGVPWLALTGAQVTAMIPTRVFHDETKIGRPYDETFAGTDRFWQSTPAQQQAVFRAFRETGAKWVLANEVPPGADVSGWQSAGETFKLRRGDSAVQYFRRLD